MAGNWDQHMELNDSGRLIWMGMYTLEHTMSVNDVLQSSCSCVIRPDLILNVICTLDWSYAMRAVWTRSRSEI